MSTGRRHDSSIDLRGYGRPTNGCAPTLTNELTFSLATTRFDEDYSPSESSRVTTNFANLARGEHRQQNLRNALTMIDRRFNELADWDNPSGDRYTVELEIVSVGLGFTSGGGDQDFPLLEVLDIQIVDTTSGVRHHGIVGNNFSSYVRDYDFSVLLPSLGNGTGKPTVPDDFGALHGKLFDHFLDSTAYRERFTAPPVICISVSTSKMYQRTGNRHPILGVEYENNEVSMTDEYFGRMGLKARFFMPRGSVAPLALYFRGDLLNDYTNLQLIGTLSTMETFQKIYRPEIYNANSAAEALYRPTLEQQNYSQTQISYDRVERSQLAAAQGKYTEEHFMKPHREVLEQWASTYPAPVA